MRVHVGINAKNKKEFKNKLEFAAKIFPKNTVFHVDISKKGFSSVNSFFDFNLLKKYSRCFGLEGHLMILKKDIVAKNWYFSPLKTLFIHEAICPDWGKVFELAKKYRKEIGIVVDFDEKESKIFIPTGAKKILVLAIIPGKSGQRFHPKAMKLISFLRKKYPHATISIDGGINKQIAESVKRIGADAVVSTSYIWKSENPLEAYKELESV